MENAELLSQFNDHLAEYGKLRGFIARANAQEGKFSAATIERVVMKNEISSQEISETIQPLVPQLAQVIDDLSGEIATVEAKKASAGEEMEELELRQIIGELTDEEFASEAASFKADLEAADGRIAALQEELGRFSSSLDEWTGLATQAGHATGLSQSEPEPDPEPEPEPDPEPEPEPEADDADEAAEVDVEVDLDDEADEIEVSLEPEEVELEGEQVETVEDDGLHSSTEAIREDLSDVFGGEGGAQVQVGGDDAEIEIEAGEAQEDDGDVESVDVDFGFDGDEHSSEIDILADEVDEVEIDLVGEDDGLGLEDDPEPQVEDAGDADQNRRALLIYQEGTAEEQIYPFTNEVITIGRGRDNDIQIKNDSKVSRYHCKVFRRGDNFYIEDNKSSNGSLVNGELITERRLFGGEEVIIGETFFRFRIME
jgi:hypothetical protein